MQFNLTTILKFLKKNQGSFKLTALSMLVLVMPAFAQTTSDPANLVCTTLGKFEDLLKAASVVVVTLAVMWAGYKFLFMRAEISECGKILAAGVMIGSAGYIAGLVTASSKTEAQAAGCEASIPVNSNMATFAHVTSPFQAKVLSLINEA